MANQIIRVFIKIIASFVAIFIITAIGRLSGTSISMLGYVIGTPVVIAIWAYKPSSQNDQNITNP